MNYVDYIPTACVYAWTAVIFWKLAQRAGYDGVRGLIMFVPVINFFVMTYLAFTDWPVQVEARGLRQSLDDMQRDLNRMRETQPV